jgi:hypothetical protein
VACIAKVQKSAFEWLAPREEPLCEEETRTSTVDQVDSSSKFNGVGEFSGKFGVSM